MALIVQKFGGSSVADARSGNECCPYRYGYL